MYWLIRKRIGGGGNGASPPQLVRSDQHEHGCSGTDIVAYLEYCVGVCTLHMIVVYTDVGGTEGKTLNNDWALRTTHSHTLTHTRTHLPSFKLQHYGHIHDSPEGGGGSKVRFHLTWL